MKSYSCGLPKAVQIKVSSSLTSLRVIVQFGLTERTNIYINEDIGSMAEKFNSLQRIFRLASVL